MDKIEFSGLTAKQKRVIEIAQEPALGSSISAVCEAAGVSRTTFYKWLDKSEAFIEAWRSLWWVSIDQHMPGIVAAQLEKALKGNTAAAKFLDHMASRARGKAENIEFVIRYEDPKSNEVQK